jgi:hypothetical protein
MRRDEMVETLLAIQRYAETLTATSDRLLTRTMTGVTEGLLEDLHAIDGAAASIRAIVGRLDEDVG